MLTGDPTPSVFDAITPAATLDSPVSVFRLDADGVFVSVSGFPFKTGNLSKDEFVGHSYLDLFAGQEQYLENFRAAYSGTPNRSVRRFRDRDYDTFLLPERDETGEIVGLLGIAWDITEVVARTRELSHSEELNRRILEAVPAGIVVVSTSGAILHANEEAQRILGLSFDHLTKRYVADFEPETFWEDGRPCPAEEYPVTRCLMTGEPQPAATIGVRRPDGRTSWAVFTAIPLNDPNTRELVGTVVTFHDITERKLMEEQHQALEYQLAQSQKLEAIGRLAGGLAHDLNNILSAVLGHASLLKERLAPATEEWSDAATIELAGERAARLTQQLLGFARLGKSQDVPFTLDDVVAEAISLLRSTVPKNIEIVRRAATDETLLRGNPGQLQQVLVNLALNSRDAMPDGGRLFFETGRVASSARVPPSPATPGAHVYVAVRDEGEGIPAEQQARVFEPFFTTKPAGKGTGMGLAMAHGIVQNHGGVIELESEVGQGTTFTVYLPGIEPTRGSKPPPARPSQPVPGQDQRPSMRVLVVDDEDVVRRSSRRLLERLGCAVTSASNGSEALEKFRRDHEAFDLVILDMMMPGMDGAAVFRVLRGIDASVPLVISSGFDATGGAQRLLEQGALEFLAKPYTLSRISEVVERARRRRKSRASGADS